jgi:prephenate dehydratase
MRIAYQGGPGAFSHEACLAFAPGWEPVAHPTFEGVVEAVAAGATERGILPIKNRYAGPVPGVEPLLGRIARIEEHELAVRLHLLALPGARLEEIEAVVSHPMAIAQCAETLAALGLRSEEAANTALAAEALDSRAKGVLASEAAASAYGLQILKRDMHDRPDNATRFAIFEALR